MPATPENGHLWYSAVRYRRTFEFRFVDVQWAC